MRPLSVAWMLEDTGLAGGTRVAVAQADALLARGHRAVLITKGAPLTWRSSAAQWRYVRDLEAIDAGEFDFVVGTFWTTLAPTHKIAGSRGIHFCQGYEGSFSAYREQKPQIDAAYALPLPKITVSPHLVEICRRFNADSTYIGQIVDDLFFHEPRFRRSPRPRVLLVGPAQADFKGIDVGYAAVRYARARGAEFDLVRVSQWPPADGEPVDLAAEFHVAIDSQAMASLIASCDAFLAPSRHEEGFGLPAAEAMAGGLAGVMSAIPSFLAFDAQRDYALFADENNGETMGDALVRLLSDEPLRRQTALRAHEVVQQFRSARTGERLERYFLERRAR